MNAFFGFITLIAMVAIIVFLVLFLIQRSKNRVKAKQYLKLFLLSFVIMFFGLIGTSMTDTSSTPQHHMTAKEAKQASEKKADQEYAKKQKEQTKKENLAKLRKDLAEIPSQTKNTITNVDLSSDGSLTATMSDEVLEGNSAQIKNIAKTAADSLSNLVDRNYPLPSPYDEADVGVKIIDSSGNTLYQQSTNPF